MSILEKELYIKISGKNAKRYEEIGYEIPRFIDEKGRVRVMKNTNILVKVIDLPTRSNIKLTKICDDCGVHVPNITYASILTIREKGDGKDRCQKCARKIAIKFIKENTPFERSLEYYAINNDKKYLIEEFSNKNNIEPCKIFRSSNDTFIWECSKCGSEYSKSVNSRTYMNTGCPYCTGQKVNHTNSLLVINPRLASEWHITKNGNLTPNDVTKGSNKKVWWQCDQGHEWKANISSRETKGCPFCSGRLPTKENNLLVYDPDVVKWWDYEINEKNPEDYTPNSGKYVWWKCVKGHSWKLQIYNMENSKGDRCPYCNGLYPSEENNLLIKYPELCKEWDYTKNKKRPEEFLPNANQKAWWICEECGNEWKAMIEQRTIGTGCPACGESKGEKRIRKYFIKNEIVFEPQKEFEGLLGIRGGNLSYDFFLPKQNLLIEYQGEFHDGNGNYYMKKNLERQQEHDKRKKEFAKQNNIKLLEIWYWDYENIESILENNLI